MEPEKAQPPQQGNIPLMYANGVVVGRTLTELQLTFTFNGAATNVVVIPFPVGKSTLESLGKAISDQEDKIGQTILDLKELLIKEKEK